MNDATTNIPKGQKMNDLQAYFPNNSLQKLVQDLVSVDSWEAFARAFLLGSGKSKATNQTYLTACRQFYEFTGGLHPMQAGTPEWIEQWYDSLPADLNTRAVKVAALKFMYRRIVERIPAYTSPFDIMGEELKAKLNRSKRSEAERDALTDKEYRGILAMLKQCSGNATAKLKAKQDYAFVRFAVTSGLRAAELVGLRWEQITETAGVFKATFTGKGNKVRTVQLERESVRALRSAFRARFGRKPQGGDYVLNGLPTGQTKGAGITKSALHYRLKAIIAHAKRSGIVRANLHVSTHTLRHTCATRLVAAGVPLDAVQRHLGHSNLATTAVYLHNSVDFTTYWQTIAGEAA
jgi:integrase